MALSTPPVNNGGKTPSFRSLDPAKYTSLGDFINTVNKEDNRDLLIKTYGNQGITGFLQMTGAVKASGTNDEVQYWEESRLHSKVTVTLASAASAATSVTGSIASGGHVLRDNDVVLVNGSVRCIADNVLPSGSYSTATGSVTLIPLAGSFGEGIDAGAQDLPIIGNLHAQGSDQPGQFIESNVIRRTNPYMILKETFKVSGSQATNIGWINVGNGDYRWYVKGEMDTRQRFLDKREMMMLLGENVAATAGISVGGKSIFGSEGYFAAIEDRGIVNTTAAGAGSPSFSSLADIDAIITELDKQGAAPEYAIYANTATMLELDDMVAQGLASAGTGVTTGAAAFGAFSNDPAAAVRLGFSSFRRGGYTFHSKSWKLLNDPTLLGDADYAGVMIPLTTVVDPKTGNRAAALEMNYKAANGYSREMEHWMTGSILGVTNTNEDSLQFNYRSECNLITRAANQHVLLKKGY
jgi:hypothetical protein